MNPLLTSLFFLLVGGLASAELSVTETLKDRAGTPLSEIRVHAFPRGDNPAQATSTLTDAAGTFHFTLPDGEWFIEVDQRELLERGYFCVPGSCFSPECELSIIAAVPLQPNLSILRNNNGTTALRANFDWLEGIQPILLRQFRIERSKDLINWETIDTIQLANPPLLIPDPTAGEQKQTYYRAIPIGDFITPVITPF
ncbi:MAG: hypothetical protein ACSHYF_16320 [Verrucomicrobiaceae bacterium]